MDSSGAAYADDQLGGRWNSHQDQLQSGRLSRSFRGTQSISNLLGYEPANVTKSSTISDDHEEPHLVFAAQVSTERAAVDHYLKGLINDSEMEQIRSENENVLSRLLSAYVFEDHVRVRSFLEDHPSTPELLLEAAAFLRKSFGDGVILQLQIPPDEELPLTIYAVALWEGTLEDARSALNKFDDTWWTTNGHRASGRIVVDYQLV